MKTFIYCIENLKTGKKYIGQHRGYIDDDYWGSGIAIRKAIKKEGVSQFKKYVLTYCSEDDVNALELQYIAKYNTFLGEGYNLTAGGDGNRSYWDTRTKEQKAEIHKKRLANRPEDFKERCAKAAKKRNNKAIGEKLKGRIYSKKTIKQMSESAKKRGVSQEQLQKCWDAKRGLKLTPEQCANISRGTLGKKKPPRTEEHKKKLRKPVIQLDLEGNFIRLWEGVSFAGKELGIDYSGISHCANGKQKTSGGYKWEWN